MAKTSEIVLCLVLHAVTIVVLAENGSESKSFLKTLLCNLQRHYGSSSRPPLVVGPTEFYLLWKSNTLSLYAKTHISENDCAV